MGKLATLKKKKKRAKYQIEPRSCMVLGLKPMGKLTTSKKKGAKYQTERRSCIVFGLKPMGKLATSKKKRAKYQTKPRSCMVFGLKPMGKLATSTKKLRVCLVDCSRRCNVIVIPMVQLFFSFVMFLLQGIIIPYEQLFFKMRNNYSSLKGCISYS